ncbi:MAG: 2-C-methyl-D-erythritol 2,4-cyclodiphosphate synthase [Oscillospiraceae bacterium]|jgi:2-C-methyl-D-erythritol 2,4-cyclodiphosphate synthase|nr:2-C-methyl-D-erythritol 2,4-cyclodiphosphate synthase [Oscillospiraceae bacterium]
MFCIGHGYDAHKLVNSRKLILGGVEIPHTHGLLGHSDADVLTHALTDALLGATALGDIGRHFPDTDERYEDADSLQLLQQTDDILRRHGWTLSNADCTILAQAPKLTPFIPAMRRNLAEALHTPVENISVKATTEEGMGFTGRCEGIATHAVVLLKRL